MDKIWFRKEAEDWNEALPIGNGSLGAMVFGKTGLERIQINEDSVWSGGFMNRINPDAKEHYKTVRKLLLNGKIQEAELLAERCMYATYPHMRHYQSLADVWIRFFKQHGKKVVKKTQGELLSVEYLGANVSDYKRELDLERSMGKVEYTIDGNSYRREFFASYPEQALVYKMEALEDAFLDFEISVTRKDNRSGRGSSYCDGVEVLEDQTIRLYGIQGGNDGIGFEFLLKIKINGGACYRMGSHLIVEGAKTAVIYMTARTTFREENPLLWCQQRLQNMEGRTYEEIKERHIKDYQSYDQLSKLTLETAISFEDLSTPERLERLRQGEEDIGLLNIYYHFARYLLISSSREGSLPSNLQGIWNEDFEPAWGSKYTININNLMEKEIFPEREPYRYFSSYEKAYEYLMKEKNSYLMSEYLKDIPTVGLILGIKLDTENQWDHDEYWFDSDMNLIELLGRNERYQICKNKTVQPIFSYAFHLELPFHVGDIVKAESFQRPPLWGVIYYEWEKPEKPEFCTMNMWLDVYDDKRETYDFVDDEEILTLTFAKEEEIPEEERYKLKMLSKARKGELDFYELLLNRGIP